MSANPIRPPAKRPPLFAFPTVGLNEDELMVAAQADLRKLASRLLASRPPGCDLDDLAQAAAIGLLRAWRRFDVDRGVGLGTYASKFMYGEMNALIKAAEPTMSLETEAGRKALAADALEYAERQFEECEAKLLASHLFSYLTERELLVIVLVYYHEMSQVAVANLLKRTPSTINETLRRAEKRLKDVKNSLEARGLKCEK